MKRFILCGVWIYSFHCNLLIRLWYFQYISEVFDLTMEQDTYIWIKVLYGLMDQGKNTTGIFQLQLKRAFVCMYAYRMNCRVYMWQQWRCRFMVSLEVESSRRSAGLQWVCGAAWWVVDLGIILYTWTSLHPPTPSSSLLYHTWTAESYFTHSHSDENNSPATAWPPGNPFTLNMHHLSSVPTQSVNKDSYIDIVADVQFSVANIL